MNQAAQNELQSLLARGMFELVPFNVAVIDRDFQLVAANPNFEEHFGPWRGRRCYEAYKGQAEPCANCHARATFEDGRVRVSDETGIDRHGRTCHYVVHLAPLREGQGRVNYVIEMTTDLTETRQWQREYDRLFERVPCYVVVIDRNFRVIRANEKFRETFGETEDARCYELYKRRKKPCLNCPAALTFEDRAEHVSNQVGVHQDGSPAYYVVTTSPLSRADKGIAHVIEIATDITQVRTLEGDLKKAQDFYTSLVRHSATGILAVNTRGDVQIMNPAARTLLGWGTRQPPSANRLREMLPADFFANGTANAADLSLLEVGLHAANGEEIPVRFSAVELKSHHKRLGRAAFMQDLREIKRLEEENLEAERLAAVGQTVAGLAHTIKNLLMGLEGGMYMVDTGLRRGDAGRITDGWQVLQRNFEKTTTLVKDFLSFAKGRLPNLRPTDPNALARGVVDLYRDTAARQGVELRLEAGENVREAPLDPGGIETCLTNLVSNGIDAAMLREQPGGKVILSTREENGELVFEVADNGAGMDQEIKAKVFTTFFTTKGGKGTGLGLLTTRKIVQEHGGRMEMDSASDKGSIFRIRLPRTRLDTLAAAAKKTASQG
ncbi:MAG: PAS domain-containing protein [Candidatus Binataceae bacterium]